MYTTPLVITLSISGISAIIYMAFLFLSYRSGFNRLLIKLSEANIKITLKEGKPLMNRIRDRNQAIQQAVLLRDPTIRNEVIISFISLLVFILSLIGAIILIILRLTQR